MDKIRLLKIRDAAVTAIAYARSAALIDRLGNIIDNINAQLRVL